MNSPSCIIKLLTKKNCTLCKTPIFILKRIKSKYNVTVKLVDLAKKEN
jgi:hypothetical protein